jgi:hypothetical protein
LDNSNAFLKNRRIMPEDVNQTFSRVNQVNIWAVLLYLAREWRWYVVGMIVGVTCGLLYFFAIPATYEASVVILPARVGSIIKGSSTEPEPAPLIIERLKQPGFFTESIRDQCQVAKDINYQKTMANEVSASLVKPLNTMVKITWKGNSPEVARACIETIVETITNTQNDIIKPVLSNLITQRDLTQKQLDDYLSELSSLNRKDNGSKSLANNFNQTVISERAAQNLRESVAALRVQLSEEIAQLLPPYSRPVIKLEPTYVSQTPIISLRLILFFGVLTGALGGILALLVVRSIRIYKDEAVNFHS